MTHVVAVPADICEADGVVWHASKTKYLEAALRVADVTPLLVPAFGTELDVGGLLARVDGVMLTGARSNVHPSLYGENGTAKYEPFDRARDATSLPVARVALDMGIPLLAICRGMQELNVALGGTLATEIQELPGRIDHRDPKGVPPDKQFALRHKVIATAGSHLASIAGCDSIEVNSLHRQAVDALAPELAVEGLAPDGTIEAVSVKNAKGFALGVQWHPEYWAESDGPSRAIFEAFGKAVRDYAARASH